MKKQALKRNEEYEKIREKNESIREQEEKIRKKEEAKKEEAKKEEAKKKENKQKISIFKHIYNLSSIFGGLLKKESPEPVIIMKPTIVLDKSEKDKLRNENCLNENIESYVKIIRFVKDKYNRTITIKGVDKQNINIPSELIDSKINEKLKYDILFVIILKEEKEKNVYSINYNYQSVEETLNYYLNNNDGFKTKFENEYAGTREMAINYFITKNHDNLITIKKIFSCIKRINYILLQYEKQASNKDIKEALDKFDFTFNIQKKQKIYSKQVIVEYFATDSNIYNIGIFNFIKQCPVLYHIIANGLEDYVDAFFNKKQYTVVGETYKNSFDFYIPIEKNLKIKITNDVFDMIRNYRYSGKVDVSNKISYYINSESFINEKIQEPINEIKAVLKTILFGDYKNSSTFTFSIQDLEKMYNENVLLIYYNYIFKAECKIVDVFVTRNFNSNFIKCIKKLFHFNVVYSKYQYEKKLLIVKFLNKYCYDNKFIEKDSFLPIFKKDNEIEKEMIEKIIETLKHMHYLGLGFNKFQL